MAYADQLEKLTDAFYEAEGENREEMIAQLQQLHQEALSAGEETYAVFRTEAAKAIGGAYLPHLVWVELAKLVNGSPDRPALLALFNAFSDSDFEEPTQFEMKPLVTTYFALESDFEVGRFRALVRAKAHPTVQEWYDKHLNFQETAPAAVSAYRQKFFLLKDRFPDFELYGLPVQELEEQLNDA